MGDGGAVSPNTVVSEKLEAFRVLCRGLGQTAFRIYWGMARKPGQALVKTLDFLEAPESGRDDGR